MREFFFKTWSWVSYGIFNAVVVAVAYLLSNF